MELSLYHFPNYQLKKKKKKEKYEIHITILNISIIIDNNVDIIQELHLKDHQQTLLQIVIEQGYLQAWGR